MSSLFFLARIVFAWAVAMAIAIIAWLAIGWFGDPPWVLFAAGFVWLGFLLIRAASHLHRVQLIAGRKDSSLLANRQRRHIEVPYDADEAFDIIDAAVRELPRVTHVESARDSLQVRARIRQVEPFSREQPAGKGKGRREHRFMLQATVTPGDGSSSVTLICEPEHGAWFDWFVADGGGSLENAEAIVRAMARRVAERRRREQAEARQTATEKELTVAQLGLLQAQVEPHFLYNTLANAQQLVRIDPPRADEMLGHLIDYLRRSLPRVDGSLSTLGEELDRSLAYLEILRLRMGDRLAVHVDVPANLRSDPLPSMMLQTVVENAIKHGLEPKTGGGGVWIRATRQDGVLSLTVADDGLGFRSDGAGTGIGLKNLRERLRLTYGAAATFVIVANFPNGVAATIAVPVGTKEGVAHA
ncbi:histidine kinase [Luteibacter rhizovicinus]|uniref:Histidine kinase n=1 Tax=Luteibacter rhizovicinus TaxID=242606 RepID=A0A4R3YY16_9GAMM|nr:histidine kinase [Luteibacter rhizovicinus]TCV96374.1 histidine kinase [Luteibacter rhizovicinus]